MKAMNARDFMIQRDRESREPVRWLFDPTASWFKKGTTDSVSLERRIGCMRELDDIKLERLR